MKLSLAIMIGVLLCICVDAARRHNANKRLRDVKKVKPVKDKGRPTKNPTMKAILDVNERYHFKKSRSFKTAQGTTKQRIEETFDGLKIIGLSVQATHDDVTGYSDDVIGTMVTGIEDDIPDSDICNRSDTFLFSIGKEKAGLPADCSACELVKPELSIFLDEQNVAHLVYTMEIKVHEKPKPKRIYLVIEACDLTTFYNFNMIGDFAVSSARSNLKSERSDLMARHININKRAVCENGAAGVGGNRKTGDINYGSEPYCLPVTEEEDSCVLENSYIKIIDLKQKWNTKNQPAFSYNCSITDDAINGGNSANLDAFFFGNIMYDVYMDKYNLNPLGRQLIMYTHYGKSVENAYFDGTVMVFGDGDNTTHPMVCLDVVTHEVAHGITDQNSKLYYSGQSGGINEAFSDISGDAIEFLSVFTPNDWFVGSDIFKASVGAWRYFQDPTLDGISIAHISDYYPGLDVHHSSGVFNKAFYEMVVTQGIDVGLAYEAFLTANQLYWGETTDFAEGACGVWNGAGDLGVDQSKIDAAFAVVGIDTTDCGIPPAPAEVVLLEIGQSSVNISSASPTCFILPEKTVQIKLIYIYTTAFVNVDVTIRIDGTDGPVVGTRKNNVAYYLPPGRNAFACFSSATSLIASLKVHYCPSTRLCYY